MKNITITVDDETYRRVRLKAAERDTSVSALVKVALQALTSEESRPEAAKRREQELRASIKSFSAAERLERDAVHR
jgi:plasmid stability protein